MTEIHAFDPDGTPSPGAQIALDGVAETIPDATDGQRGMMTAQAVRDLDSVVNAVPRFQAGKVIMTPVVANTRLAIEVQFPEAFGTLPAVTVTPESGVPNVEMRATASSITTTGFTMNFYRATGTDTAVMWIAVAP